MLDILGAKEKAENFAYYILSGKKSLVNAISKQCSKKSKKDYYKSHGNFIRSLNVYYSYNVLSKHKYLSIRKAKKNT